MKHSKLTIYAGAVVAMLCFTGGFSAANLDAAVLRYSAAATITINRTKPTDEELATAAENVKHNLLVKIISEQEDSRKESLQAKLGEMRPDDYFVQGSLIIVDKKIDKDSKRLTIVAQVDSDSDSFNKILDKGQPMAAANKLFVAWVFAARRQDSVLEFDPEVSNNTAQGKKSVNESTSTAGGGTTKSSRGTTDQSTAASSGGVLRKADAIVYIVADEHRARIDKAMSGVLVNRGFAPVPSSDLQANSGGQLKISKILEDYKTSTDLADENKILVMQAANKAEVDLFATGTVTLNTKSRDPATGSTRIGATVDAQVLGFRKSRSSNRYVGTMIVASTGSRVVVAIGKDQTEAETKAIEDASILAANILCDQLGTRERRQ